MEIYLISIGIGLFVGLVLAFTGAGGSILAVPLLAFGLDMSMTQAAPIGLLAVTVASAIGAKQGLRVGIVRYKAATLLATSGIIIAPLGVWLAHRISNQSLNLIFACVLIYVSLQMWEKSKETIKNDADLPAPACEVNPATSKLFWTAPCTKRLIFTGSVAGFLSGLLGLGGGFIIVPTLNKVSNLDMKSIVATSLAVIALISTTTLITYFSQHTIDWHIAISFSFATILSMIAGRFISNKLSNQTIQRTFACLAFLIAIMLTVKVFLG